MNQAFKQKPFSNLIECKELGPDKKLLSIPCPKLNSKYIEQIINLCLDSFGNEWSNDGVSFSEMTYLTLFLYRDKVYGCCALLTTGSLIKMLEEQGKSDTYGYGIKGPGGVFIHNLCVSPKFRGYKIGSLLVEQALKVAKQSGYKYAYLHVYSDNKPSLKIFLNNGFMTENELPEQGTKRKVLSLFRWLS